MRASLILKRVSVALGALTLGLGVLVAYADAAADGEGNIAQGPLDLNPPAGGPRSFGPAESPIILGDLKAAHVETDVVIETGIRPFPLRRHYTATGTWSYHPWSHQSTTEAPGAPFGVVLSKASNPESAHALRWWHDLYSFAYKRPDYFNGSPIDPVFEEGGYDVRAAGGESSSFTLRCVNPDGGEPLETGTDCFLDRGDAQSEHALRETNGTLVLYKQNGERHYFEPITGNRYYWLTRIEAEGYGGTQGRQLLQLHYEVPTAAECPTGTPSKRLRHVANFQDSYRFTWLGTRIRFVYGEVDSSIPSGGTDSSTFTFGKACVLTSIELISPTAVLGETTSKTLVSYEYAAAYPLSSSAGGSGHLGQVTFHDLTRRKYEYGVNAFRVKAEGYYNYEGVISVSDKSLHVIGDGGAAGRGYVTADTSPDEKWVYTPNSGDSCSPGVFVLDPLGEVEGANPCWQQDQTYATPASGFVTRSIGNGSHGLAAIQITNHLKASALLPGGVVTRSARKCTFGCEGVGVDEEVVSTWQVNFDRTNWERHGNAGYTVYTYAEPIAPPGRGQTAELTTVKSGAASSDGASDLSSANYAYIYGGYLVPGEPYTRLLKNVTRESVVTGGADEVKTEWFYEANDFVWKKSTTGHTRELDGTTVLSRQIGTLYSSDDPLGRVTLALGPCALQSNGTYCSTTDPIPGVVYSYYSNSAVDGVNAGRLKSKKLVEDCRVVTSGSCSSAPGFVTTYSYDALGNVITETGASGQTTHRIYSSGRLYQEKSCPSAGAPDSQCRITNFEYDAHRNLTAVIAPSGEAEVYCYRQGADSGCWNGTLKNRIQWKGKAPPGTTGRDRYAKASERVVYSYWGGRLADEKHVERDPTTGAEKIRKQVYFEYDPFERRTYEKVGTGSPGFVSAAGFDTNDNLTRLGFAYRSPPAFCLSAPFANSPLCVDFTYDRLNRLVSVTHHPSAGSPSSEGKIVVQYDRHGNVSQIGTGCPTTGTCPDSLLTKYEHDDFGNVTAVTAPWTSASGQQSTTRFTYDARGNVLARQTPAMRAQNVSVHFEYDGLNRELVAKTSAGQELRRSWYDAGRTPDQGCSSENTLGRLQVLRDSLGEHWYSYDAWGAVTHIKRRRAALGACSDTPGESHPNRKYAYDAFGRLISETYPHGRIVYYDYGSGTLLPSRLTRIRIGLFDGNGTQTVQGLVYDIRWEPYGAVRTYRIATASGIHPFVEYARDGSSEAEVQNCEATRSTSDQSGRLRAVSISRLGSPIYRRAYRWRADQVAEEHTCLLGGSPEIVKYEYDHQLRLTKASRPPGLGFRMTDVGGSIGLRKYEFIGLNDRGNRTIDSHDCWRFQSTYESGAVDRLNFRIPTSNGCIQTCSQATSIAGQGYAYDVDGRATVRWTPANGTTLGHDSAAAQELAFDYALNSTNAALGGVYRQVAVRQGSAAYLYEHFYDAAGRRRFKTSPFESDGREFFYEGTTLLEDRGDYFGWFEGLDGSGGGVGPEIESLELDEYVWLDGRPVAMIKSSLRSSEPGLPHGPDSGQCKLAPCGVYHIVTDHIGKPIVMLDNAGLVTGTGDYDPFGHVNRATHLADSAHPYAPNANQVLASIKQPVTAGMQQQFRARFAVVDTEPASSGTYAYVSNMDDAPSAYGGFGLPCAPWGGTARVGAPASGSASTCWVDVPSNGVVQVRFRSSLAANTSSRLGVAMEGYEFRRAQVGAAFVWTPLRLPGQYHDPETDLFENWNRFYDPSIGRYLSPDPILMNPGDVIDAAASGMSTPPYAYAINNPIGFADPDGREFINMSGYEQWVFNEMLHNPTLTQSMFDMHMSKDTIDFVFAESGTVLPNGQTIDAAGGGFSYGLTDPGGGRTNYVIYYNPDIASNATTSAFGVSQTPTQLFAHELGHVSAYQQEGPLPPPMKGRDSSYRVPSHPEHLRRSMDWEFLQRAAEGAPLRYHHDPQTVAR